MRRKVKTVLAGALGWEVEFEDGGKAVLDDEAIPSIPREGDIIEYDPEQSAYAAPEDGAPLVFGAKVAYRPRRASEGPSEGPLGKEKG